MKQIAKTLAIVTSLLIANIANAAHYSGNAGANAYYELDTETGILRIYGTGETYNRHGNWWYFDQYKEYDATGNGKDNGNSENNPYAYTNTKYTGSSPIYTYRNDIKTVIIEEGITSIGAAFFYQCSNMTSITMPSTLKLINYEAFRGCTKLETIEIGAGVERIMGRWTTDCSKLNYISVAAGNTHFVSIGGVLYTSDLSILVRFPEALNTKEYVIPEGTVYAATDALYKLALVESITIPTTMVDIEYGSFDSCPKLKTLVLKSSTPPTLHKTMSGTSLSGIYVPCGEAATYTNNGNWSSYGGGKIQDAVVVEFYVETNNVELGDVEITSRADCEGYEMTITAKPTPFGTFTKWDDGVTTNPRTIAIDKEDLSIIYRYKAIFSPKPYTVTLEKKTTKIDKTDVKNKYQVEATKDATTISTSGSSTSTTGTFYYGDVITLYCNVASGSGVKFNKWGDGNTDNPRTVTIKETGSYTGKMTFAAEIAKGNVTIKTASNDNTFGTTTPATQSVSFGTEVTITATPKTNYQLMYWSDEPDNKTPELTRTISATADKTYTAYFGLKTYKITATPNDAEMGECSGFGTFQYGKTTTLIATPNTGYKFVKWNDGNTNASRTITVTANADYIATFEPIKYTIRFYNEGGTLLETKQVDYNTTPTYTGATPTKTATAQYTYTHSGWTPAIAIVTGAADYTATYSSTLRSYKITFKNYDGTILSEPTVNYGITPANTGAAPTRAADAQYTYTHNGWTPTIAAVTGEATYTATYSTTTNQYTIRFMNGSNVLQNSDWDYNDTPIYSGTTPTKAATAQHSYTFSGWLPMIDKVTRAQDYSAQFSETVNKYFILFKNDDGTTLQTSEVEYGTKPTYTKATPTKAATAEYTYTFKDWDSEIVNVTGAKTYTATYTATKNKYTVRYENYDGSKLQETEVDYGQTPSYIGATPTKPSDAEYDYTFSNWSPDESKVTGNVTYVAQFSTDAVLYTITFNNYDGSKITDKQYPYNATPSYTGTAPTRAADAQYTYTFSGWSPTFEKVTANKTYTATYITTTNKYTITFIDDDNSLLKTLEEVEYGTTPNYGAAPTKASTAEYTYSFAGWSPTITTVTGAATYKATYNKTLRQYTITFIDGDGVSTTNTLNYGDIPTPPVNPTKTATAKYTYTFSGYWDKPIVAVSGDATYTAQFNSTINKYTVKFVKENGDNWQEPMLVEYDVVPTAPLTNPTKESTTENIFTWAGWTPTISAVTGNVTYKATYTSSPRPYTINFVNYDNSPLKSYTVLYGSTPTYDGDAPTRPQTEQYIYTWNNNWEPEIAAVTGDATYKATFNSKLRQYTVRYLNYDGTEIFKYDANYGSKPANIPPTPTREGNTQYRYEFKGWSPSLETTITENIDFKAEFNELTNAYTITFVNYNGDILYESDFNYDVVPTYNGDTPEKPSDVENNYTFIGWGPTSPVAVTGPATYTAQFSSAAVLYTITFNDYDGATTEKYEYNATINHPDPVRPQDDNYIYTFTGWTPAFAKVTADAEYTANYSKTVRQYPITFIDGDGSSQTISVNYNDMPEPPFTPSKAMTDEFEYTFSGWQPERTNVTKAATYTAQFTPKTRKYRITFVDYDNTPLKQYDVEYNQTPTCETPVRAADVQYTYTFSGWSPTISSVTGDATYKAEYTSEVNKYTLSVLSNDATMGTTSGSGTYNYNEEVGIRATAQIGYHFVKWNDDETANPRIVTILGDAEYTAQFEANNNTEYTLNIYTQNIENDDYQLEARTMTGTTKQLSEYIAPTREGFTLQDYEQVTINADGSSILTVYYNRNSYALTWNANGGNELNGTYTNGTVKYGTQIIAPTTERTGFDFSGWLPNLTTMPAEDIECMAQWTEKGDTPYTIEHYQQQLDGTYTIAETDNTKTGKTNTQTNVAPNNYNGFSHDHTENCLIAADGTGVAKIYYTRNSYNLTWLVDGKIITENCTNGNILFGSSITEPTPPTKIGYTFNGWGKEVLPTMPAENTEYIAQWSVANNTPYIVEHYLQNIDNTYSVIANNCDTLYGITNEQTNAVAKTYEGFTAQTFEQQNIAANGSTIIRIEYNRNTYTLTWNMGDATISAAEYTQAGQVPYGAPIIPPVIEKHGYTHTWEGLISTMPANDVTITAIWEASNSLYIVNHRQQCLNGEYSVVSESESLFGLTGALTQAEAKEYPGFTVTEFTQDTISAQNITTIDILYSRNPYELKWNLNGGTAKTDSCTTGTTLFGTPIVAPQMPEKQGYLFEKWNIDIPGTMPAENLTLTAIWKASDSTTYYVEHYAQNIDGSYPNEPFKTDSLIGTTGNNTSATDRSPIGFNVEKVTSDTIAGDGSSVAKVYYSRNKYELKWELNGGEVIDDNYTHAGQVAYGTPIVAPTLIVDDNSWRYVWDSIPETMPASNWTSTATWIEGPIVEPLNFEVPENFSTCDGDTKIEITEFKDGIGFTYRWSINGEVDTTQTGATYTIPDTAAPIGIIYITVSSGNENVTKTIHYQMRRRIVTTMWDDVITIDNTTGNYESYKWYHNGEFVGEKAYYQEVGGLTGSYYVVATTTNGTEIESCGDTFSRPAEQSISAYPNPTIDKVYVKSSKWNSGDRVTITDENGKVWKNYYVTDTENAEFDLNNLLQGTYIINVGGESVSIIKL